MSNPAGLQKKYRVGIPTTSGISWIVGLDVIDPLPVNQVLKLDGFEQLGISSSYHQLCQNALLQLGCRGPFRLTLSDDIESGRSWELPVLLAHLLHKKGSLAFDKQNCDESLLATGAVGSDFCFLSQDYRLNQKIQWAFEEEVTKFFTPKQNQEVLLKPAALDLIYVENLRDIQRVLRLEKQDPHFKNKLRKIHSRVLAINPRKLVWKVLGVLLIAGTALVGIMLLSVYLDLKSEDKIKSTLVFSTDLSSCFEWYQTGETPEVKGKTVCGIELASLDNAEEITVRLDPKSSSKIYQSAIPTLMDGVILPTQPESIRIPFREYNFSYTLRLESKSEFMWVFEFSLAE